MQGRPNNYTLRASQDSKRAIKYENNKNGGFFTIYNIENTKKIHEIYKSKKQDDGNLIDCAFFPSAFGFIIALGYDDGKLEFIREKPDNSYTNIDCQIGGPDNEIKSNFELEIPKFHKNLRVSLSPPELNIGYISNGIICIFYVDFQTSLIKLIPIRRYDAPNTLWFNFTNSYSIWRCIFVDKKLKLENYDLNMFEPKAEYLIEPKGVTYTKEDFVDASISPVQFDGTERIAVLTKNGDINFFYSTKNSNNNTDSIYRVPFNIKDPVSVEWSPLGTRIAVFSSSQEPTLIIETSCNTWNSVKIQ